MKHYDSDSKKRFGGKIYHYSGWFSIRSRAQKEAAYLRAGGMLARIEPETSPTAPTRYHVWVAKYSK